MKPVKIGCNVNRMVKERLSNKSIANKLFYQGFWSIFILFFLFFFSSFFYLSGQDPDSIASGNVTVQGLKLQVDPLEQTIPRSMGSIVNTTIEIENPVILNGMVVKGTLTGPGLSEPLTLTTLPNHPFTIPGLPVKGHYKLENIRLERKGQVLVYAEKNYVDITVMDIIVTKVETRPLTLDEIKEKGIVYTDEKHFTAYNFTIGLSIQSEVVEYSFPVLYQGNSPVTIPSVQGAPAISWSNPTIANKFSTVPIPVNFTLPYKPLPDGEDANNRPAVHSSISGVVIFNNDVAFLNQFFSVMFIIANNAPEDSNIQLKDLTASITYPDGLRQAETNPPQIAGTPIPVRCPGPDGEIGTSDDLEIIMASFSGMAEFLAEGVKKGTHYVDIDFNGILSGLPTGDTPIEGKASGAVIVRHPEFSITFAHPAVIREGEKYEIMVTMTNTSPVAANEVSLIMPGTRLLGTSLDTDQSEKFTFETIKPGESQNTTFKMIAKKTGQIRATAFEGDSNVSGKFVLTVGVGEKNIPLSPDTLVFPEYAYSFPNELINAAMRLLGEAHCLATTPPGGIPKDAPFVPREIVETRARDFARAGQGYSLGDSLFKSSSLLTLDWLGNKQPEVNFDMLRRFTSKGLKLAEQQALIFNQELTSKTPSTVNLEFAQACSYKSPFMTVMLSFPNGNRTATFRITDELKNRLSYVDADIKQKFAEINADKKDGEEDEIVTVVREIPFGEFYFLEDSNSAPVDFAVIGSLDEQGYDLEILGTQTGNFDLSIILPDSDGALGLVEFSNVSIHPGIWGTFSLRVENGDYLLEIDQDNDPTTPIDEIIGTYTMIQHPPLVLISAVQDCEADDYGHATALFFSRPIDKTTATDKNNYQVEGKEIYNCFYQPSGRIVIIGTDSTISPFVESKVQVQNIEDITGQLLTPSPVEMTIEATTKLQGGVVYGYVLSASGLPIVNAQVQLVEKIGGRTIYSQVKTDESGFYQFDFVHIFSDPFTIQVLDPETGKAEQIKSRLLGHGQRQEITIIMKGMGNIMGKVVDSSGNPIGGAMVLVEAEGSSLAGSDQWQGFMATTIDTGEYRIYNIPLGHVNVTAYKGNQMGYGNTSILTGGESVYLDITLVPINTGSVHGQVFESDGITPVVGTYVNIYGTNRYACGTQTNDQGYFEFQNVPVGTIKVEAYNMKTAKIGGVVNTELTEGQDFDATIIFRGKGRIYGTVTDAQGTGMPNILVYLEGSSIYMDTNSNGEFNFTDVPVGSYEVRAINRLNGALLRKHVQLLIEGQEAFVTLAYPLDSTLRGKISGTLYDTDGVTPLVDKTVQLADGNFFCKWQTYTSTLGQFEFPDLETGNYTLFSELADKVGVSRCSVQTPGQDVFQDINMLGYGKVTVNVFAPDEQTPLKANVIFRCSTFEMLVGSQIGLVGREDSYTTGENGSIEIYHVLEGEFSASAQNVFYPIGSAENGVISYPGEEKTVNLVMPANGKVIGHVKSWDNSTLVGGVTLKFKNNIMNYPDTQSAESGDIGYFEFDMVTPGWFQITAEDSVSGLKGIKGGLMPSGGGLVDIEIRLLGKGDVQGAVKNPSGDYIPNAGVKLKTSGYPYENYETTADEYGQFTIYNVWEGDFSITAYDSITRGGVSSGNIAGHNAQTTVEIIVDPIGTVKGHVFSSDGSEEITDVQVALYHQAFQYNAVGYFYVTTAGPDGGFSFENIPQGDFYVEAFQPSSGCKGRTDSTLSAEGEIVELEINLEGRGTVTGVFYDGSHIDPIPHTTVTIESNGKYPFELSSATDANGFFEFQEVGQGNFELTATDPDNGLMGTATGTIEYDGQKVICNVYAQGWGTVKGTVFKSDGTTKMATAQVKLTQGSRIYTDYTGTDPNPPEGEKGLGEYQFNFVPTGSFSLTATDQAGRDHGSASGYVEFHSHEDQVDILLTGLGIVKGQVLDGNSNPLAGIPVTLQSGTDRFSGVSSDGSDGLALGEFRFEQVRMGNFSLTAKESVSGLSGSESGELVSDGQEVYVSITLESAGSVSGRVLLSDGTTPAVNAIVKITGTNVNQYLYTNTTGEFEFTGVRLGTFSLEVIGENNTGRATFNDELVSHGDVKNFGDIVLDSILPTVIDATPVNGSNLLPINSTVTVQFSEPMTESRLNGSSVRLVSSQGDTSGSYQLSQDMLTLLFTPSAPLSNFTLYTIIVDQSVTDLAGNTMAGTFTSSFTTIDAEGPQIIQIVPANNTIQVPLGSNIAITFNEPIDIENATPQNFILNCEGTIINCTLQWGEGDINLVLIPDYLTTNKGYTLTIQGLKDVLGNTQAQPFASTFYTTDTVVPEIVSFTPSPGTSVLEGRINTNVTANLEDDDVDKVYFYLNGKYLGFDDVAGDDGRSFSIKYTTPLISQSGQQYVVEAVAEDHAGNQSERASVTYNLTPDEPPTASLEVVGVPTVLPGHSIQYKVFAQDDKELRQISLFASGGVQIVEPTRTFAYTNLEYRNEYFTINIPADILPNTEILIHAEAVDSRGNTCSSNEISISIPSDEQGPNIEITSPVSGSHFNFNDTINIEATVTDDISVKEVRIYLDDQELATHDSEPFTATYEVPSLVLDQTSIIKVEAEDYTGKISTATVNVVLEHLVDETAPKVKILSPSTGSLVFANENLKIKIEATDDQEVTQVEFFVDDVLLGAEQTIEGNIYNQVYEIPLDAEIGSTINIRVVATDVDNKSTEDQVQVEVVTGTPLNGGVTIDSGNTDYDNQTIIIREGEVAINGDHSFLNVLVKETGKLSHMPCTTTSVYNMNLNISGKLVVGCDASVNVNGCGYVGGYRSGSSGNTTPYGYTLGNTDSGGSYYTSGGSYGGFGGFNWGVQLGQIYGSIENPSHHGSGGGGISGASSSNYGGSGGGIIMLTTSHIINDGQIASNGLASYNAGGGSGGSVQITSTILSGSGKISANGGNGTNNGAGGGGRVAIYYEDISQFDMEKITAHGGANGGNTSRLHGYCGTVYLKAPNQEALLILDNNNIETYTRQTYPDLGHSQITNLSSNVLTDSFASFMPDSLIGMELIPDINEMAQTFTIIDNDQTTITTDPADGNLTTAAAIGDTFEGMAVFNGHVIIRNNPAAYLHDNVRVNQLSLLNNSKMAPKSYSLRNMNYCILNLDISGNLQVDATSAIDLTGYGYLGGYRGNNVNNLYAKSEYNDSSIGRTLGDTTTGGSSQHSGGSYGGLGGKYSSDNVNECYGSVYLPQDPGSGGGAYSTSYRGGSGGGVLIIHSNQFLNDGDLKVNGFDGGSTGGGAGSGGSIQIHTSTLSGNGNINANGGDGAAFCGGGGGRIAIYYEDATNYNFSKVTAFGGSTSAANQAYKGGAGTIYLEQNGLTGNIIINNGTVNSTRETSISLDSSPSGTSGTITGLESHRLVDANAQFIPGNLAGMLVIPNIDHAEKPAFKIIDNTRTEILTDPVDGDMMEVADIGDHYGLKYPTKLELENAQVNVKGTLSFQELNLINCQLTVNGSLEATQVDLQDSQVDVTGGMTASSIISDNSQMTVNGSMEVGPFTLDNSHLTLNGNLDVGTLNMQAGSEITHSVSTTTTVYNLQINAQEIVIDESSSIHANHCGYLGSAQGDNLDARGRTLGNTNDGGSNYYSGASHGGWGGVDNLLNSHEVNKPYGSIEYPTDPGSGGGGALGATPNLGGNGGGVIIIHTTTLTNNGEIFSKGQSVTYGAGAGGSIQIHTNTLSGIGSISANGGDSNNYGAASGGRIAVYYQDASGFNLSKINAYGGANLGGVAATEIVQNGAPGTVYLKQENQEGQLIVDNNNTVTEGRLIFPAVEPSTITGLSSTVLTDNNASYMIDSLIGLKLIPNINKTQVFTIVDNDATTITITIDSGEDDLTTVASVGDTYEGKIEFAGHLVIQNTPVAALNGKIQLENLSVLLNSNLEHSPTTELNVGYLNLNVTNQIIIDNTSSINADGLGYLGAFRNEDKNNSTGYTLGNTTTGGSEAYTGASYGGLGGQYTTNNVNVVYGSLYEPTDPGSGGGGATTSSPGGNGGGIVLIQASELVNEGSISSNGQSAKSGAGSGGSVLIRVTTLSGNGSISTHGGDNTVGGVGGVGGTGGGGRIAIYYEDASGFNLDNITAYGGNDTLSPIDVNSIGGAGTVYLKASADTTGTLIIDNNNHVSREDSTPLPAVGQGSNTLLEENKMTNTAGGNFIPGALIGMKLNPQPAASYLFTIINNTGTEIFTNTDDGDMTEVSSTGSLYIGEHLLLNLTVKGGARLFTLDRVQVSGTLTIEPGSTFTAENHQ